MGQVPKGPTPLDSHQCRLIVSFGFQASFRSSVWKCVHCGVTPTPMLFTFPAGHAPWCVAPFQFPPSRLSCPLVPASALSGMENSTKLLPLLNFTEARSASTAHEPLNLSVLCFELSPYQYTWYSALKFAGR